MKTTCELYAFGAMMLVILLCLVWYMAGHPAPHGLQNSPFTATTTSKTLVDHGDYYTIDATYPAGQASVAQFVADTAASFKQENGLNNLTPEDIKIQGLGGDKKYTLSITYDTYASPHTYTYLLTIYEDTLGAHPNGYYQSFTFDDKTGAELQLADLFTANSGYLDVLSKSTRASLYASLGDSALPDFVDPGTTPDAANFQFFALDGSDLVIFFPPYAVGPYAIGPQTVRLPRSQFSSILKPEYK